MGLSNGKTRVNEEKQIHTQFKKGELRAEKRNFLARATGEAKQEATSHYKIRLEEGIQRAGRHQYDRNKKNDVLALEMRGMLTQFLHTPAVVSLTGGIASGKSTASKLLSSPPHLLPLIDLDLVAREVVEPKDSSKTLSKLVNQFGESILQEDGTLDRPALGRMTFGKENEGKRKMLNKITHSAIRKRLAWRLLKFWMTGRSIVIIDTPLAVEAGLWKFCGEMMLVWCPPETQLSRMLKRDADKGITEDDANHRLNSQLPLEMKLPYADVVLDNADGAVESLEVQVQRVVQRWRKQHSTGLGRLRTILQFALPPVGIVMALWAVYSRTTRVGKRKRQAEEKERRK